MLHSWNVYAIVSTVIIMNVISERLALVMREKNLSYGELSQMTGIPKSALFRYTKGETDKPPIARLQLLAKVLNVDVRWLMGMDQEELLDDLNKRESFVTSIFGPDIESAERVQTLIDENQPDKAAELCRSLVIKSALNPESSELAELLESLRGREDMRMLFKLAKDATPEDVRQAVRIIEALRRQD